MDGLVSETDSKAGQIQSLVLNSNAWNACFSANNPQGQLSNPNILSLTQPNSYSHNHIGSSNNIRQNNIAMGQTSSFDLQQSFILPNIDIESLLLEKQHLQSLTSPQSSPERNNNLNNQASQLQDYSDQMQRSMYLLQSTTAAHAINNNNNLNQQQQQQQPFVSNAFSNSTQNLSHSFLVGMPGMNSTSMHHQNAIGYSAGSFASNHQVKSVCKSLLYEEMLKTSQSGESQNNYHSSKMQQQQQQQLQIQSLNASSSGIYYLDLQQNSCNNNGLKSEFEMQRDNNISRMQFIQQQQEFSALNEPKGYTKSQFSQYQQPSQHQGLMQNAGRQFDQTDSGNNVIHLRSLQQQKQEKSQESPRGKDRSSEERNQDVQLRQKFEVQLREFNLLKNQTRAKNNNNSEIESSQEESELLLKETVQKNDGKFQKQQNNVKRNIFQTYFSSKERCRGEIEMLREQILTDYECISRVADILEKKSTFTENHVGFTWKRLSKQIILIRKQLENVMKLSVEDLIWKNNVKEASKGLIQSGSAHLKKLLLLQPFEFKEASREIPRNMGLFCQKTSSSSRKRRRTTSHQESPLLTCQGLEGNNLESCLNKNEEFLSTTLLKKEHSDDGCAYGDGGDGRHSQRCNSFSSQKRNSIISCKKTSEDFLDSQTQISKSKIEGTIAELSEKNTEIFENFNGNNTFNSQQRKAPRKYSNYSDSQMLLKYKVKSNRKRKTESFLEFNNNNDTNDNSERLSSLVNREDALLIGESSEYEFRVEQDDITKSAFVGYVHKLTKERVGRGILMLQNGSVFYGYFKNNKPACLSGRLSSKNHIGYHGGFKEGLQSGNGTQLLRNNGHRFTGNFAKGKRSGFGTMQQKDGAYFTGHWVNDLPEEFGESQINTHLHKKDILNHNNNNSNANSTSNAVSCRDQSYQIYQGNWLNGKKHGTGILFTGVVAQWENDRFLRILS